MKQAKVRLAALSMALESMPAGTSHEDVVARAEAFAAFLLKDDGAVLDQPAREIRPYGMDRNKLGWRP